MADEGTSEEIEEVTVQISGTDLVFLKAIMDALGVDQDEAGQRLIDLFHQGAHRTVGEAVVALIRSHGVEPPLEVKKLALRRRAWKAYVEARRAARSRSVR